MIHVDTFFITRALSLIDLDVPLPDEVFNPKQLQCHRSCMPLLSSHSTVLRLEQVLSSSNSYTSSNAQERPRVDDLGEAWPEAVLLSAVLLEFEVLVRVILRVTLFLIFFVLPAVCQ
jgi:hypothetical protein